MVCFDSAHPESEARFNCQEWSNALVLIDECESGFWHLLDASTCIEKRRIILHQVQDLIKGALSSHTAGRVIVADADLSDLSLNFVLKLAGQEHLKPYIICNEWSDGQNWQVFSYPKSKL